MGFMRRWGARGLVVLAVGGCARDEHAGSDPESVEPPEQAAHATRLEQRAPAPPLTAADSASILARLTARSDSIRAAFGRVSHLGAKEVSELRQDRNAEHVARARSLGVRVSSEAEVERLRQQGRLVALGDSTPYWVLRRMDHSSPYVTPETRETLIHLGRRFHARLDSLGLPRYRMKVTSVIRTDGSQAALRKINSYATRSVSAHEFGTTLDVSHERFAVPAGPLPGAGTGLMESPAAWGMEARMLEEVGKENAKALQAELGRAISELRGRGALLVMMENAQPVYHMTLARPSSER